MGDIFKDSNTPDKSHAEAFSNAMRSVEKYAKDQAERLAREEYKSDNLREDAVDEQNVNTDEAESQESKSANAMHNDWMELSDSPIGQLLSGVVSGIVEVSGLGAALDKLDEGRQQLLDSVKSHFSEAINDLRNSNNMNDAEMAGAAKAYTEREGINTNTAEPEPEPQADNGAGV